MGLMVALDEILYPHDTSNDPGVDMTLDGIACFLKV